MVYKPKSWVKFLKVFFVIYICILMNGVTFKQSKDNIIIRNENLSKNIEKIFIDENAIADLEFKEPVEVEEKQEEVIVVPSKYLSLPERGFTVTTDNRTYELSYSDFVLLAAVIASEANRNSIDDVLAVSSVILNRADTKNLNPIDVVTAPGQFSGYLVGYYLRYMDDSGNLRNVNQEFIDTVHDALAGTRNNTYYSFRSWGTSSYSDNYITENGNRYN